jgi:tripartite-type tricarboxylate transporter receptor subunit TctC
MASALLIIAGCSSAATDTRFFKGKEVAIIVPYGRGGGNDVYARAIAPFLQKYLTGSRVVVRNLTGNGGLDAKNLVYEAAPDGLTLCLTPGSGLLLAEWEESPGIRYQTAGFSFIGRLDAEAHMLASSPRSRLRRMADFTGTVRMGFTGQGTDDYTVAMAAARVLGYAVEARTDYLASDDAALACVRGELDAVLFSVSSLLPQVSAGTLVPVAIFDSSRVPDLPEVPAIFEVLSEEARRILKPFLLIYALDRTLVAPPRLPAARLEALRAALDKAITDPELLGNMARIGRPLSYLTGARTEQLLRTVLEEQGLRVLVREAAGARGGS